MISDFIHKAKNYFTFNRSQRGGMIILSILILIIIAVNFALPYLIVNTPEADELFLKEIEAFRASIVTEEVTGITDPFPFDPNIISFEKMLELGLTEYQANMIVKYRQAGGEFYKKEDFKRIYSISDEDYELLKPFISINKPEIKIKPEVTEKKLIPMPFNPNSVDSSKLSNIGLSEKQIRQVINYREAGGKFRIKSDFRKIYSITESEYSKLEKYILLPSRIDSVPGTEEEIAENREKVRKRPMVEVNSADTNELTKLYGIGPYYSKRILAYRDKLGGFYDKSQLLEVFGIDSTRYFNFADQVTVNRELIRKIDLNDANFKEILRHPYFEYYLVKAIFNYKDAVGDFGSVTELKQIDLLYDQLFNKLEPYLTVEKEAEKNEKE